MIGLLRRRPVTDASSLSSCRLSPEEPTEKPLGTREDKATDDRASKDRASEPTHAICEADPTVQNVTLT